MKAPKPDSSAAVDTFMAALEHPHTPAIERLRHLILAADPSIAEGIKWNAPSFRTGGYFATTHLRAKDGIGLILHLGAKVRDTPGFAVEDPEGLLHWLAKDRAMLSFASAAELQARSAALTQILRQWIAWV